MLRYVHYNPKFEKRLNSLKKSENRVASAAKKAEEIITSIINNGEVPLSMQGKFTNHGEARIKNCIKFDIGKGYRLVCVKEKDHLFLLYIGSHDDCTTWIENNKKLNLDLDNKNITTYEISRNSNDIFDNTCEDVVEKDYEELLLEKITEKDLKYVFSGLWKVE